MKSLGQQSHQVGKLPARRGFWPVTFSENSYTIDGMAIPVVINEVKKILVEY